MRGWVAFWVSPGRYAARPVGSPTLQALSDEAEQIHSQKQRHSLGIVQGLWQRHLPLEVWREKQVPQPGA